MRHLLVALVIICLVVSGFGNARAKAADAGCVVCVVEFQTRGDSSEDEDFIIIANVSTVSQSLSSVQLQYINSNGLLDSKISLSGTLVAGQQKTYVADSLKSLNPTAASLPFALFSGGGTLQIIKVLTTSSTVFDRVGWGDATIVEVAPIQIKDGRNEYMRRVATDGVTVDAGNNSLDFQDTPRQCDGLNLSEIQPYVTDSQGQAVNAWVELMASSEPTADCSLVTSLPSSYLLPLSGLPHVGETSVIDGLANPTSDVFFQFALPTGAVWLASSSYYGGASSVKVPVDQANYTNISKGQSAVLVNLYGVDSWQNTYQPTPGLGNVYDQTPSVELSGDPSACSTIEISEIMPNPTGSDTDTEWLEIHNKSDTVQALGQCQIEIEGEIYWFLPDSMIGQGEYRHYNSLWNETGGPKTVSLRNTDQTYVALSRIYNSKSELIQSFTYEDAPEAEAYAKFDDGWAWTYKPTPDAVNELLATAPPKVVTDKAVATAAASYVALTSPGTTSSNSSAKATTKSTTKATTTKVKAATAVATPKVTKAKTTATLASAKTALASSATETPKRSNPYLFVGFGAIALLYAGYEYRTDITNRFAKFRANRATRRAAR